MSIFLYEGRVEAKNLAKKASTALAANSFVEQEANTGYITAATSSSATLVGVLQQPVVSTDTDYAQNTTKLVLLPLDRSTLWRCTTASDIAVTDVGEYHDLTDAVTVNPAASSTDVVLLRAFLSAREGAYSIQKPHAAA